MKPYTTKQMGDACEMLVAAELTLAGVPALKVPDNWPGYDVVAQRFSGETLKISVKSRTWKAGSAFVIVNDHDHFDWLAVVILHPGERRVFLVPHDVAVALMAGKGKRRRIRVDRVAKSFAEYENNFSLNTCGKPDAPTDE